jgi:gas vesicle protein
MAGVIVGSVISAGAGLLGAAKSSSAAQAAADTQANAAKYSADLSYQISQQQLAAQKNALDKQIAASGATVDKQLVAQRDALNSQLAQNADAFAFQKQMYEQTRADFAPYRESGTANLNQLNTLLGIGGNTGAANYGKYATAEFTPAAFLANQDPGYGFRMSEGLKAVDRQAAARGGLISGNALKASQAYGQDMASQEYQNAFNRYQTVRGNTLSPFQSGAAAGQSAAAMQGQSNVNFGNAGANAASANSAAYGAYGQGVTGALGNAGNAANTAYGNYGQGTTGVLGAYGTNATNALTGGANANAAGIVGSANAFNQGLGGISNLANTYYVNSLLNGRNNSGVAMNLPQGGFNSGYEANAGVNFARPNVYG